MTPEPRGEPHERTTCEFWNVAELGSEHKHSSCGRLNLEAGSHVAVVINFERWNRGVHKITQWVVREGNFRERVKHDKNSGIILGEEPEVVHNVVG
jgi:hypothetical protein